MNKENPSSPSLDAIERPPDLARKSKPLTTKFLTLSWNDLPDWQRDNEYILSGYRPAQNGWSGCVASVFVLFHNETVNIHSHFWGATLFAFLLATFRERHVEAYETTTWADTWAVGAFLVSVIFCLSASTVLHIGACHSEHVNGKCRSLDYLGIIVLATGSFIPFVFYAFFCDARSQACHLLAFGSAAAYATYIVLNPEYTKPMYRNARTKVFLTFGLFSVVPVVHAAIIYGSTKVFSEMGFGWILTMYILYIGGAMVYAKRFPERISPGNFDYFCSSHQIFHVFVVLGVLAYWFWVLEALQYRHSVLGSVCPA